MKKEKSQYLVDLDECMKKRKAEYPPVDAVVAAILEGVGDEMNEIKRLRAAVKEKYPKPDPNDYTSDEEYQNNQDSAPMKKTIKAKKPMKGKV